MYKRWGKVLRVSINHRILKSIKATPTILYVGVVGNAKCVGGVT